VHDWSRHISLVIAVSSAQIVIWFDTSKVSITAFIKCRPSVRLCLRRRWNSLAGALTDSIRHLATDLSPHTPVPTPQVVPTPYRLWAAAASATMTIILIDIRSFSAAHARPLSLWRGRAVISGSNCYRRLSLYLRSLDGVRVCDCALLVLRRVMSSRAKVRVYTQPKLCWLVSVNLIHTPVTVMSVRQRMCL